MTLQRRQSQGLQSLLYGTRARTPEAGGTIEECAVHHLTAGGVWITRPDFDGTEAQPLGRHVFGPLPYTWPTAGVTGPGGTGPHTHSIPVPTNQPVAGDRCLVVWAGPSQTNGWAVGWWPR